MHCLALCFRSLNSNIQYNGSAVVVPRALASIDLGTQKWRNESVALPANLADAQSAAALVSDRHLFIVAGQVSHVLRICRGCGIVLLAPSASVVFLRLTLVRFLQHGSYPSVLPLGLLQKGAECSPATTTAYRLDLRSRRVHAIPELPEPRCVGWTGTLAIAEVSVVGQQMVHDSGCTITSGRPNAPPPCTTATTRFVCRYSPALAMLGDGRLHAFGGLLPDRVTPAREHWSLGIKSGEMTSTAAFICMGSRQHGC